MSVSWYTLLGACARPKGLECVIADMPQGLQAAEFIKRVRVPGENRIDYE